MVSYMNTTPHTTGYTVTRTDKFLPATHDATGVLMGEFVLTGKRGAEYYSIRQPGWDVVGFFSLTSSRTIRIGGEEFLTIAELNAAAA